MRPSMVSSTSGPPLSAGGIFVKVTDGAGALLPHAAVQRTRKSHVTQPRDRSRGKHTLTNHRIVRGTSVWPAVPGHDRCLDREKPPALKGEVYRDLARASRRR